MTDDELFDVLRQVVLISTGLENCVLADQNAPSVKGEYATIKPNQTVNQRGQANVSRSSVPGVPTVNIDIRSQVISTCSVNFYRGNARNNALKLKQCNKRPDVSEILFKAGVGWNHAGPVNDISALQSGNIEQRTQLNLFVMYELLTQTTQNSIERITLIGEDRNGDVLSTTEIISPDAPVIP